MLLRVERGSRLWLNHLALLDPGLACHLGFVTLMDRVSVLILSRAAGSMVSSYWLVDPACVLIQSLVIVEREHLILLLAWTASGSIRSSLVLVIS